MYNDHFEQFTLTLANILKCVKKIKDKRMNIYGLRSSHVMVLYLLGRTPEGLTPVELAESGSVDKALISRIIYELTDKGFVVTNQVEGRRYKVRLVLTPSGKEAAAYIASVVSDVQKQVSGNIPAEDLETFYRVLFSLQENFQTIVEQSSDET